MKAPPTDPLALQSRMMDALIGDILDPNAKTFARLDALRETMNQSTREGGLAKAPAGNHGK